VFGGGIMLELAKMAVNYSLHVVAGGVKGENKGDSIQHLFHHTWHLPM